MYFGVRTDFLYVIGSEASIRASDVSNPLDKSKFLLGLVFRKSDFLMLKHLKKNLKKEGTTKNKKNTLENLQKVYKIGLLLYESLSSGNLVDGLPLV